MSPTDVEDLRKRLHDLDGKGYGAYKSIKGAWSFPDFTLHVDWVQGDPYASPSRVRAELTPVVTELDPDDCAPRSRALGVATLLARRFAREAGRIASSRGSGRSGQLRIEAPGQEVLDQTAVIVREDASVEARFQAGLPARGRRILGRQAAELLTEDIPEAVRKSLLASSYTDGRIRNAADVNQDADALRAALVEHDLIGFVADESVLPRRSGVDQRPLEGEKVVPFRSPDALRVTLEAPNAGEVTGMGIPRGVTLVVGGGYHGKSTVLEALERGVYNHIPGDGRERVVSDPDTVKVRAEDGRSVAGVDISNFIGELPDGTDTTAFTTPNASGSTSQAAAIMEAVESGASCLLVDEDTAATNFMIRDRRMQALVPRESEPITPFVDRVRQLYDRYGISSVLVIGGSGDYLEVADTVVTMKSYVPQHVTDRARTIAREFPTGRLREAPGDLGPRPARIPLPGSVDPSKGKRSVKVKVRDEDRVQFGTEELDLSAVGQIVSWAQTRTVTEAIVLTKKRFMDGRTPLPEILDRVMDTVAEEGLDVLGWKEKAGDLVAFRRHELAAALNRLRTLEVQPR